MQKCEPWAIARCPDSKACGDHVFTDGSDCDKFNQRICNQLPTRADRVRSMSDEGLADYIYTMQKQMCERFANIIGFTEPLQFASSAPDLLDWLRQPAEE